MNPDYPHNIVSAPPLSVPNIKRVIPIEKIAAHVPLRADEVEELKAKSPEDRAAWIRKTISWRERVARVLEELDAPAHIISNQRDGRYEVRRPFKLGSDPYELRGRRLFVGFDSKRMRKDLKDRGRFDVVRLIDHGSFEPRREEKDAHA